jgi:hypothetical protein
VRLKAHFIREVEVLSGHTLSGPYPTVTAPARAGVESNRRRKSRPQDDELDSADASGEPASERRSPDLREGAGSLSS